MTRHTIQVCSPRPVLVVLLSALLAPMSPLVADSRMPGDASVSLPRASENLISALEAGDALILGRKDRRAVMAHDDPRIHLAEIAGLEVVLRLTPTDSTGIDIGSGRVIVLGPSEERVVRLREELITEARDGVQIRVDVLQGGGRVLVYTPAENGSSLQRQPAASQRRRRAVTRPGPLPTSFALIDKAETAGTLNSETALLYRVYSLFSDARLPEPYRGDDSGIEDSLYMTEVRDRFATLSPALQDTLVPYLTPPAYQGSWANAATGSSPRTLATPPPCQFFSDRWASVDSTNGLVRVWYRVDLPDLARANSLVTRIDSTIWPKIAGLMTGRLPISDISSDCNGGNGRLDVYLADVARSDTIAYTACNRLARPVFILLKRTSPDVLAVHEIFHAFQFAYPLAGCVTDENYRWWAEASAEWSQDFVIPADKLEHDTAPSFLNVPEKELDLRDAAHEYGAYLLPFYVYRKTGSASFVRASWESSATQPALEALDQALPGGFEAVWPEFARYNWNRDPVEDYKSWDGLTANARPAGGSSVIVSAAPDFALNLALGLPRLSATYKHFFFDDSAHTIVFWNGVTTNLVLRERTLGGLAYENDAASADQTRGAHITALIKIGGQWKTENWTDLPYRTYCRDMVAERLEELVLIISNSDFKTRDRKLEAPGLKPVLFATNMGCWQWKGTTHYDDGPGGLTLDTTVTWTRAETSQTTPSISYQAAGTIVWKMQNEACSGGGALSIEGFSTLTSYNFITSEGTFHRSYVGAGTENRIVSVTCGQTTAQFAITAWLVGPLQPFAANIPGARFLLVNSAGNIMDDSHEVFPGLPGRFTWHFVSQREP